MERSLQICRRQVFANLALCFLFPIVYCESIKAEPDTLFTSSRHFLTLIVLIHMERWLQICRWQEFANLALWNNKLEENNIRECLTVQSWFKKQNMVIKFLALSDLHNLQTINKWGTGNPRGHRGGTSIFSTPPTCVTGDDCSPFVSSVPDAPKKEILNGDTTTGAIYSHSEKQQLALSALEKKVKKKRKPVSSRA
ncbi:hypothetical protein CDAR_180361 [Caerostris darwini]|uniref:Uncharacterized protein n=1 Tax=Caerostris darwini TaxID=1538125 RepID=A0AAV4NNX3_9ARAC|nr:hypothetical protein CDAR_180361 [Caerostris darwini]